MSLRVWVRFVFVTGFVFAVAVAGANSAKADSLFQQERLAEEISAEPMILNLSSSQHTTVPSRVETASSVSESIQAFGKQSGEVRMERIIRDPSRITIQPGREGVIATPEPVTLVLLGTGLTGVAGLVRRHRRITKTT